MHVPSNNRPGLVAGFIAVILSMILVGSVGTAIAGHPPVPGPPIDDPIDAHIDEGKIQLELETIAEGDGLTAPNWGTYAPGVPDLLFVVDQDGPLWAVDTASGTKNEVLNVGSLLVPLILEADERGFLGVAFHPGFATNGLLYTMTSEPIPGTASTPDQQPNHLATVREWTVPNPAGDMLESETLTPQNSTSRVVLTITEPQFNHNGGALFFGTTPADRHLMYITSGDGGCADDQNGQLGLAGEGPCISHEGEGNAQTLTIRPGDDPLLHLPGSATTSRLNPLGKILRMDPTMNAEPEIYAFGFRNPFRASADRTDLGGTGLIWTADVGQNNLEEVNARIEQGGNYGWHIKEGTFRFNPNGTALMGFASDGFVSANTPGQPANLIDPVAQYDHDEGVASIGGFVYRGSELPELYGSYVFGDYSDGFNSANGRVMYVDETDNSDPEERTPNVFNLVNGHINLFVLGIGEDMNGELYVLANKSGGPDEERGVVMKLVRECDDDADCRD